jgi:MtrB/PioB family decaheme-associated outer membrane protein
MKTFSPLFLLGALGALSTAASTALAQVDTAQWKCETCPFDKAGVSGVIGAGLTGVSDRSAKFSESNGYNRRGAQLAADADLRYGDGEGLYGDLRADTSRGVLRAEIGQEGRYAAQLSYVTLPHRVSDSSLTPFLGSGSSVLTLPPGFAANSTAAMPLASSLQSTELGSTRSRLQADIRFPTGPNWTHKVSVQHELREGTQPTTASFFASAAQMAAPVDQTTDQLEISTRYTQPGLHIGLAYQASLFRNAVGSLTWANPFNMGAPGTSRGQLALAPDNQLHQVSGSAGYEFNPWLRASGDFAVGRLTQDASFLAPTLNGDLGLPDPAVLNLPARSLNGRVDTFNGSVRLTASPSDRLRVNFSYARDRRDNRTASLAYPAVQADLFLGTKPRSNVPFDLTQDRYKLHADYRGPGTLKASAGIEQDDRQRNYQEVLTTSETTVWGRMGLNPRENLSTSLKLSHADRSISPYGRATWIDPRENPLLRKFNLAARTRDMISFRADLSLSDKLSLGLNSEASRDAYSQSSLGLISGRAGSVGADLSWSLSTDTQVQVFAQADRLRGRQAGSQSYAVADWWGSTEDRSEVYGVGVKHNAMKGKLQLAANLNITRSHSDMAVDAVTVTPGFPSNRTAMDSLKLQANYQLTNNWSVMGAFWHEHYESTDWRLAGVLPGTLGNLLTLGDQPPQYRVSLLQLMLRYKF